MLFNFASFPHLMSLDLFVPRRRGHATPLHGVCGEAWTVRGDGGSPEVVDGGVLDGPGHAARRALDAVDDVDEQLLLAATTMTLADEARHSDLKRIDPVEADLTKVEGLRSPHDVERVRIGGVREEPGERAVVVEVELDAESPRGRRL